MQKQKGNILIWLVLIIVIIALAVWYFMKSGYKLPGGTAQEITTASDVDAASKDLDGTDLGQMDEGINQVNQDSSSF